MWLKITNLFGLVDCTGILNYCSISHYWSLLIDIYVYIAEHKVHSGTCNTVKNQLLTERRLEFLLPCSYYNGLS